MALRSLFVPSSSLSPFICLIFLRLFIAVFLSHYTFYLPVSSPLSLGFSLHELQILFHLLDVLLVQPQELVFDFSAPLLPQRGYIIFSVTLGKRRLSSPHHCFRK